MPEFLKQNPGKDEHPPAEGEANIYGRERFSPDKANEHVESLIDDFKDHFSSLDYQEVPPVKITSGIDPTVRFIGSHISVLKPYLAEDKVPTPGVFMRQNCLRTRNAEKLLEDSYNPNWGSYFSSIGALAAPGRLKEACDETLDFLENRLRIAPENLLIRAASADQDLLGAVKDRYGADRMEIDSRDMQYYRHQIGMPGVWGRNFNIALKDPKEEGYSDIGNIIILQNDQKTLGIEIALGTSTTLKQLHGLDHVQDCTPVVGLEKIEDQALRRKFEDAIITSTVLFREGLRPFGQNNRNRILKQYLRSISYFRGRSGMALDRLQDIMAGFENREFEPSEEGNSAGMIAEFIQAFENGLSAKKTLTDDESRIAESLKALK